jgi:hypothetical protein
VKKCLLLLLASAGCQGSIGAGGPAGTNTGPSMPPGPAMSGGQIGGGRDGGAGPAVVAEGESFYWLQSTSVKVQPTTAAGPAGGTVSIEGARGATESHQVVLRTPAGDLIGVDAMPSDLTDGAGDVIAAGNVFVFREFFTDFSGINVLGGTLPAPANSPTNDGMVPDALVPLHDPYTGDPLGAGFDVPAGKNQPLWIDVRIPIDQPYGVYTGAITFSAASGETIKVPLAVTVWDITLPDMRAIPAWFKLDYNYLAQYHAGVRDCFYSSCAADSPARRIITNYQELLHQHRIDPKQVLISYPNDCSGTPDFSAYDAQVAPYMDGSYWQDGVPSSILQAPFGPGDAASRPQSCGQSTVVSLAGAWASHLKSKGWFDRTYVYAEDEPPEADLPAIAQQAGWMGQADPDWKWHIFDTTMATATSAPILDPSLGLWVLCLKCYENWYFNDGRPYGRAEWAARLAQGIRFWFYDSNAQGPPYPGLASNTLDAAEPRMMMWGSWYEGASGFLYWSVDNWDSNDPWGPTIGFAKTGDGMLIYPGDHSGTNSGKGSPPAIAMAGPVPSIRLKMARSGLQDWALFLLADRVNLRDMAKAEIAAVYSQMGGCEYSGCLPPINGQWFWKTDYDLMTTARRNIANALLATRRP